MSSPALSEYAIYTKRRNRDQRPSKFPAPQVSIVTVVLNAAASLEHTIDSVQTQSFTSIEQVFIDGGSTDGTIDIIRRRARQHDYWITGKDRGISDAFNKGVAMARGRFINILNAGDWFSPDQIASGVAALRGSDADFVFGDLIFYADGVPVFTYAGDPGYAGVIHRRMPAISHPTVLAARSCFERIGLFDPVYRNAMDYDWLLRLHRAGGRGIHCPGIVGHMTHDGVSTLQFKRTIDEVRAIAVAHGRNPILAAAEARARYLKTAVSQPVKRYARPLYSLARRLINPSYRPVPAKS